MVKSPYEYFASLLGIRSPWFIQQVLLSKDTRRIQFHLGYSETQDTPDANLQSMPQSMYQSIHQPVFSEQAQIARWSHRRLGIYQCYISSMVYAHRADAAKVPGISQAALLLPHFIGEAGRYYTQGLRQQVAQLHLRGLTLDAMTHALGLERNLLQRIVSDIDNTPATYRPVCALPCASEVVWEQIIGNPASLHTDLFALRLLISKLKHSAQDSDKLALATQELRQFFIVNHAQLAGELVQLHGLPLKQVPQSQVSANTSAALNTLLKKPLAPSPPFNTQPITQPTTQPITRPMAQPRATATKLVLPSLKNSIWLKLITGKVALPTNNQALRLQLTRLGHVFQQARHSEDRLMALQALRNHMKTHAKLLMPELRFINQLLQPSLAPLAQHSSRQPAQHLSQHRLQHPNPPRPPNPQSKQQRPGLQQNRGKQKSCPMHSTGYGSIFWAINSHSTATTWPTSYCWLDCAANYLITPRPAPNCRRRARCVISLNKTSALCPKSCARCSITPTRVKKKTTY